MGYDITFHPISKMELKKYFFDVIEDPKLAAKRAVEISKDKNMQELALKIYGLLGDWKKGLAAGEFTFSNSFAYGAAIIAGILHPYWYSRDRCVSFLGDKDIFFRRFLESLCDVSPKTFKGLKDESEGMILENYVGGGYIDNSKLKELKDALLNPKYGRIVGDFKQPDDLKALLKAVEYALAHKTGILEASEIVVPLENQCATNIENLRAEFRKNL